MSKKSSANIDSVPQLESLIRRAHEELVDSFDEELELEMEDERGADRMEPSSLEELAEQRLRRNFYFKE
jgi:hypothetical protein